MQNRHDKYYGAYSIWKNAPQKETKESSALIGWLFNGKPADIKLSTDNLSKMHFKDWFISD